MDQHHSVWTSLEIVKLVVSLLTPLMILLVGIWASRLAERFKAVLWATQKITEKRIGVYDELSPLLNDLFCYYYFVGNWKELSPRRIVEIKRQLDKRVSVYAPLFSPHFKQTYNRLISLCFETYIPTGGDPKLRTSPGEKPKSRKECFSLEWDNGWDQMFSDKTKRADAKEVRAAYEELMSCFAKELGVGLK